MAIEMAGQREQVGDQIVGGECVCRGACRIGVGGGLWEQMILHFELRREDFLAHYHKRSNVESRFSMIKAKFRDHVRAKTPVAMVNEVLANIICQNICVLIQESHEMGIEVGFQKR